MTNNVSDLIARMRELGDASNTEKFARLKDLLGPHIRYHYEAEAQVSTDSKWESLSDTSILDEMKIKRIILTSNRLTANFAIQLTSQCNGLVLDFNTWNILSYPSKMFNPRFRYAEVKANIANYRIYRIKDGTNLTLYHYDGRWCMSTTNGYDVSNYRWLGENTYMENFRRVAAAVYPKFSFDDLNKNMSYTMIMRTAEFHPFLRDPENIWFVQSYDNLTGKISYENDLFNIHRPENIPATNRAFRRLTVENENALNDCIKQLDRLSAFPYGYILRCDNSYDIVLESSLLKFIRQKIYNLPKDPIIAMEDYIILREYLSFSTKEKFTRLFPQYSAKFAILDHYFDDLVTMINAALVNNDAKRKIMKSTDPKEVLAHTLTTSLEGSVKINPFDKNIKSFIRDYIVNGKFFNNYMLAMAKK